MDIDCPYIRVHTHGHVQNSGQNTPKPFRLRKKPSNKIGKQILKLYFCGFGSPIPNRSQTYSLKDFSYPKSSTCSANLNSGVFAKLNLENTFWPNYFCKKIL